MMSIFGPDGRKIFSSGDPAMDQSSLETFLFAYDEGFRLREEHGKRILFIGTEGSPFPIPLVKDGGIWRFDTAAGLDLVVSRRIGSNELNAVGGCMAYVEAQREYAKKAHDGKAAGAYARRFASTPGRQDGLYWEAAEFEESSPLGGLAALAAEDGYRRSESKPLPFYGYFYRILTAQGKNAVGGPRDYLADGELRGGFGLIAFPAEYGNSGVMTFIVNHDGVVRKKDLGPDTAKIVAGVSAFDPDPAWTEVR